MSDVEHEFVVENRELRVELERVRALAREAIARAVAELDRANGRHSVWFDQALGALEPTVPANRSRG
jgi:hypothetical protein